MTAKERARMDRLARENAMLREQNAKHVRICGDLLVKIIELEARLETIRHAADDPQ